MWSLWSTGLFIWTKVMGWRWGKRGSDLLQTAQHILPVFQLLNTDDDLVPCPFSDLLYQRKTMFKTHATWHKNSFVAFCLIICNDSTTYNIYKPINVDTRWTKYVRFTHIFKIYNIHLQVQPVDWKFEMVIFSLRSHVCYSLSNGFLCFIWIVSTVAVPEIQQVSCGHKVFRAKCTT